MVVKRAIQASSTPASDLRWPDWIDTAAVGRMKQAVAGRPAHAYLLTGPRGVGKSELAKAFAKAVCCPNRGDGNVAAACGQCSSCRAVERGGHPDVEVYSLESQAALADKPVRGANLSIETVRRLRAAAALLPFQSERRVLLVEDAETLLEPAQQALLKILEEPPPAVTIVLLVDEVEVLLPTVRSRCQEIPVRPVSEEAVERALLGRGIGGELAREIAVLSMGRPGWAIDAALNPKVLQTRREEWQAARAWVASSPYERLVTAFRLGEQFPKRRTAVIGTVQAAITILRRAMLGGMDDDAANEVGGLPSGGDSRPALGRAIAASLQCLSDLDANVRPRLALEAMVMAWPNRELRTS